MSLYPSNLQTSTSAAALATLEISTVTFRYLGIVPTALNKQKCCPLFPEACSLCTAPTRKEMSYSSFLLSWSPQAPKRLQLLWWLLLPTWQETSLFWHWLLHPQGRSYLFLQSKRDGPAQRAKPCKHIPAASWIKSFDIPAKIPTVNYSQWSQPSPVSTKGQGNGSQHQIH